MLAPWDKDPIWLSREEKAVLWQLFTGSKSGSGNPYRAKVGKKVAGSWKRPGRGQKGKKSKGDKRGRAVPGLLSS